MMKHWAANARPVAVLLTPSVRPDAHTSAVLETRLFWVVAHNQPGMWLA